MTTYSNDTKPTSSFSNDTKPSSSFLNDTKPSLGSIAAGMAIGLLLSLTYADTAGNTVYLNDSKL